MTSKTFFESCRIFHLAVLCRMRSRTASSTHRTRRMDDTNLRAQQTNEITVRSPAMSCLRSERRTRACNHSARQMRLSRS